jgi:regulator of RNase E activity RraA
MSVEPCIRDKDLEALRHFDTCTVSNAIETFRVRLCNTGFADSRIHCMFEDFPPVVGYAATARLRTGEAPMVGGIYHERTDWWNSILQVPPPRIVVLEDVDAHPGVGAFVGGMHGAILRALGCVGYATNGAVRELPLVRSLGLQLFAGNVSVSHAYAHIFDLGSAVNIGGLEIKPGDLLHGDRNGLLTVPAEVANRVPPVATRLRRFEEELIVFCQSKEFSLDRLRPMIQGLGLDGLQLDR